MTPAKVMKTDPVCVDRDAEALLRGERVADPNCERGPSDEDILEALMERARQAFRYEDAAIGSGRVVGVVDGEAMTSEEYMRKLRGKGRKT